MKKIHIKNMVCLRCINSVRDLFIQLQISYNSIQLGEVVIVNELTLMEQNLLSEKLISLGFELLNNKDSQTVNAIKTYLVETIHYGKHDFNQNISVTLSELLHKDYSVLSKLFSKVEGITIEKYIMYQKVEKVKELLSYKEMTISEIAFELNYSSAAHLSNQFKKVTGLSPSQFKKTNSKLRKTIDDI